MYSVLALEEKFGNRRDIRRPILDEGDVSIPNNLKSRAIRATTIGKGSDVEVTACYAAPPAGRSLIPINVNT